MRYDPERGSDGVTRRDNEQEYHVMITSTITSQALFPIMAINREEAISILRKKVQDKEIVPKVILQYDTI